MTSAPLTPAERAATLAQRIVQLSATLEEREIEGEIASMIEATLHSAEAECDAVSRQLDNVMLVLGVSPASSRPLASYAADVLIRVGSAEERLRAAEAERDDFSRALLDANLAKDRATDSWLGAKATIASRDAEIAALKLRLAEGHKHGG